MVLSQGSEITTAQLHLVSSPSVPSPSQDEKAQPVPYHEAIEAYSRTVITEALRRCNGNKSKAAEELEIQRTYLNKMIKKKGISTPPT